MNALPSHRFTWLKGLKALKGPKGLAPAWAGLVSLIPSAYSAEPESGTPESVTPEQYEALLSRPLFGSEPIVQIVTKEINFAVDLTLRGVSASGGDYEALLFNTATGRHQTVTTEANPEGIRIVSVAENADPNQVSVTLIKGEEKAVVRYSPTDLTAVPASPNPAVPSAPGGGRTPANGPPPGMRTPPSAPSRVPPGMMTPPSRNSNPPPADDFLPPSLPPDGEIPQEIMRQRPTNTIRRLSGIPRPQP